MSDQRYPDMTGTETTRRGLWQALAATELPLPVDVTIYEHKDPDEADGVRRWASIRLEDNAPQHVDAWTASLDGKPAEYSSVIKSKGAKPFRSYAARVTFAGWPVEITSYVDTAVVKP